MRANAWTDGGGNTGYEGSCACVIQKEGHGAKIKKAIKLGSVTNNVAEYRGVILALETALDNDITHLKIYSDSRLIVEQIKGLYKSRHPDLKPLLRRVRELGEKFERVEIEWIPREDNRDADALCRRILRPPSPRSRPGGQIVPRKNPFLRS